MQQIILVNKPQGLTPLQVIAVFREQNPLFLDEKISFAGRLDPMAEGLLILLVGDENKKRKEYESLPKTYEFELLLGISTDTYDCLGRITKAMDMHGVNIQNVQNIMQKFVGTLEQEYPPYSSKAVRGKPLYYWAREGKINDITIPTKEITISTLTLNHQTTIGQKNLIQSVLSRIGKIQGDFRQESISQDWQQLERTPDRVFTILKCTATVSSGTYIRSLCYEIGREIKLPAIAYSITRTRVGDYQIKDAITLTFQKGR